MYLAPRQGLFAIIILVSFCLQTLLLVISTDQQLTKIRSQKGEQMVAQLIDEARLALENKDRVSLSVIANRYTSEQDVARLLIKDSKDEILVPMGNAPLQEGVTITQLATKGDSVLGSISLTLKDVSKGEIIAMQWVFVLGSLLLHILLWVTYIHIARPTKEQIETLKRSIHDSHRDYYAQSAMLQHSRQPPDFDTMNQHRDHPPIAPNATNSPNTAGIHDEVNAYLKSQQNSADAEAPPSTQPRPHSGVNLVKTSDKTTHDGETAGINSHAKLSSARAFDSVSVQIKFHDEHHMLERMSPETLTPYLALCTQLLNQAVIELLKQPLLVGITMVNQPYFDVSGAGVTLKADNSHAKVALAGVMLAKLYLMLNKIIHDKHVELGRFALLVKAGVSDSATEEPMTQLLQSVGRQEQLLMLLPKLGLKQIGNHIQVYSLKRPTSVYERECAVFDGGNDAMIQRLADVRNAVLLSGGENQ